MREKLRIMDMKQVRIQVLEGLVQKYTHVTLNLNSQRSPLAY